MAIYQTGTLDGDQLIFGTGDTNDLKSDLSLNLQEVTDNGAITTNSISVQDISGVNFISSSGYFGDLNSIDSTNCFIIGKNNSVSGTNSLIIGNNNNLTGTSNNIIIGNNNDIQTSLKTLIIGNDIEYNDPSKSVILLAVNGTGNNKPTFIIDDQDIIFKMPSGVNRLFNPKLNIISAPDLSGSFTFDFHSGTGGYYDEGSILNVHFTEQIGPNAGQARMLQIVPHIERQLSSISVRYGTNTTYYRFNEWGHYIGVDPIQGTVERNQASVIQNEYYLTGIEKSGNSLIFLINDPADVIPDPTFEFGSAAFASADDFLTTGTSGYLQDQIDNIEAITGNYLTGESDTLQTVTDRGNITTGDIGVSGDINVGTISMLAPPDGGYANAERKLYWDEDLNTLSIGVDENLVLHAGQDQYYYIKAEESISKGDVIYASGVVGASSKIVGAKYIADNTIEELYVLGLAAQDIAVGEFGYVAEFGRIRNFVTTGQNGENWSEGDILYASPTVYGGLTNVQPIAPYQDIPVAIITYEADNGSIFVRPTRGFHLDELHDVHYPSNPTANDLLSWTSNNRWEPVASSDVSVGNSAKINTTNDTSTTTLYPVMVGAAGNEQTPKVTTTTTALKFDASTRELTVGSLEVLGLNKSINIGDGNTIDSSSEYSLSVGKDNQISGSVFSFSYGKDNVISNSQNSVAIGEYNSINDIKFINQLGGNINREAVGDQSGYSVSMNSAGDRVAIGARLNDGNGTNSGSVRVYRYNSNTNTWVKLGQDIDGEAANDQSGVSVSINSAGDRVAIGANYNDGNGTDSGHVRIYEYDTNTTSWVQLGSDIDGEAAFDQSGYSVSMNSAGDRVAIGARLNDGNGADSGSVRIYEYDANTTSWVKLGQDIDGEATGDQSGISVSMNSVGNRVVIGSPYNDGNGTESGSARIYEYDANTTSWVKLGQDIDGEAAGDISGFYVSINSAGDRVAIGATFNDGSGTNSGHVRIYKYDTNTTSWVQLGQDIDGEASFDYCGPVSINSIGDIVAIGATSNDGNGVLSGHVRIYKYYANKSSWIQIDQDIDGQNVGDEIGLSVSLNSVGDRVAIGSLSAEYTTIHQINLANNIAIGHANILTGIGSTAVGYFNNVSRALSSAIGHQISLNTEGVHELGYWSTPSTRGSTVRVHGKDSYVAISLKTSANAYTDGGATPGSEADGTIMRESYAFRKNGGNLFIDYNDGGTIYTKRLISGSGLNNYIPVFDGVGVLTNSSITDDGTTVTINAKTLLEGTITVGSGAGGAITNTALGNLAFVTNTVGILNTAIGNLALTSSTTASGNTAVGGRALRFNTTGARNVGIGLDALTANIGGTRNVAVGYSSLSSNTSGSFNTAVGYESLKSASAASNNTAIGYLALTLSTTGNENIAIGSESLAGTTVGSSNTAVGFNSMKVSSGANRNTALGANTLLGNNDGDDNTAIGYNSMIACTSGNFNTGVGRNSFEALTGGDNNTAVGAYAGDNTTTGNNNTSIGYQAQPSTATIGNQVTLGNSSVTTLRCNVQTITSLSDARDKTNIETLPLGLNFINSLNPIKFDWKRRDGSLVGKTDIGFLAQELQKLEQDFNANYLGMVCDANPEVLEASYGRLLPIMIKAIQELSAKIDALSNS